MRKKIFYFVLSGLEHPRQDKNLLYRHDEPNEPTMEGVLSYVLLESPFSKNAFTSTTCPIGCSDFDFFSHFEV